jgi:hypothetical protein
MLRSLSGGGRYYLFHRKECGGWDMATSVEGTDDGAGFGVKGVGGGHSGGDGVVGTTSGMHKAGIRGIHTGHISAIAISGSLEQGTTAVKGQNGGESGAGGDDVTGSGVWGDSTNGRGVAGTSSVAPGVVGHGPMGVQGFGDPGVQGTNETGGTGVQGVSASGRGVWGISESFIATVGDSVTGTGVWGASQRGIGVFGAGFPAGQFNGDVNVTGTINVGGDLRISGADFAEDFDAIEACVAPPGTVMTIDDNGALRPAATAYDKAVAGVVSGAGNLRPAIVLDTRETTMSSRVTVALVGKVHCQVDAQYGAVNVGDLLTTSPTSGHAMKATNREEAFGAILGKALRPLPTGKGLIPVLIALQ